MIIFEKKVKKFLLLFLLITSVITSSAIYFDKDIKNHFVSFKYKTFALINFFDHEIENPKNNFVDKTYITIMDKSYPQTSTHMKELVSGYQTWQLNKYFGGGIKSFRNECPKTQIGILQKNCSPHPHNYYLEILSELGLFGFMIIIIIFLRTIYEIFIKKYFLNSNLKKNLIITPFIFIFLAEIFPLKTTGSFFSSGNATFVFFILAVSIALSRVNIKIKKIIFK